MKEIVKITNASTSDEFYINFDDVFEIAKNKSALEVVLRFKYGRDLTLKSSNSQSFKELSNALIKKFNNDVNPDTIREIEVI